MKKIKYCRQCINNPNEYREYFDKIFTENGFPKGFVDLGVVGYYTNDEKNNKIFCQVHSDEKLMSSFLSPEEYNIISTITNDVGFIRAMEDLKQSDPIEFQLKISQFKANLSQTQLAKEDTNKVKCPKCGSAQITTGARGVNHFWGFIGASKTVNRCAKCGHTWKP